MPTPIEKSTARRLHGDERGAVMMMGLLMSCFLIGGLWFLIGVGDAIIFREKMQEAPDHAGFASAVLHAKGMNFISLLNAVLLVMTMVYILLGIVHDVMAVICVVSFGTGCGAYQSARQLWHRYFDAMKPVARAMHVAEEAVAYGSPWVGMGVGAKLGREYGKKTPRKPTVTVLPMSLSMVPGRTPGLGKKSDEGSSLSRGAGKYGLPVEARPFNVLCDKAGKAGASTAGGLLGMSGADAGSVTGVISSLLASGVKARYCGAFDITAFIKSNDKKKDGGFFGKDKSGFEESGIGAQLGDDPSGDKFWSEDGPLLVYSEATNGDAFFQVWTFNLFPKFEEKNLRKIGLAAKKWGPDAIANTPPAPTTYFSQAEFYYDCTKGWKDAACHGEVQDSNASYNMRWTVRLRAFQGDFGAQFGGALSSLLTSGIKDGISKAIEKMNVPRFLAEEIGFVIGDEIADMIGLDAGGALRKKLEDELGGLNLKQTPYH
jgi:hypothetical protein